VLLVRNRSSRLARQYPRFAAWPLSPLAAPPVLGEGAEATPSDLLADERSPASIARIANGGNRVPNILPEAIRFVNAPC
jgi:hypothetical protein